MSEQLVAGRYELLRPLGHGAMSLVDLAHDVQLGRDVAIKRLAENLARDEPLRDRFLREARLAARVAHPNVVRVYDVGEDNGQPFIAMEYVEGETLAQLVARRGPLPSDEASRLGLQACRGLAAVHEAGLVHRDVKPQNLFLGDDGVLKLGDFGIAVLPGGTRITTAGTVLGTAAYLAPEQARGEQVTAAADIYGLGAVLYELVSGRPPRVPSTLVELAETPAIEPPAVAPALARLVMRCLAEDPAARPSSASEVARELAATLPEGETVALPTAASERATTIKPPPARRRPRAAVLIAAVAIVVVLAGLVAAFATLGSGSGSSSGSGTLPRRAPIAPVPRAADAEQQARNIAGWLRAHSR